MLFDYVGKEESYFSVGHQSLQDPQRRFMQSKRNNLIITCGFGPHTWPRTEGESSWSCGGFVSPSDEFEWS